MDDRSGDLYPSKADALRAGVPDKHIVELYGTEEAIKRVSGRVRMASKLEAKRRKARRKMQKASRRGKR